MLPFEIINIILSYLPNPPHYKPMNEAIIYFKKLKLGWCSFRRFYFINVMYHKPNHYGSDDDNDY